MNLKKRVLFFATTFLCIGAMSGIISWGSAYGADLAEIKKRGVLRHLGVPYANFVSGSGDGMDVELVKRFAEHLGVRYEYVKTGWENVIGDLTGKKLKPKGSDVTILGEVPVKGDLIANGLTKIPWRQKVVNYSTPTFPTQVWLVARADSAIEPIKPSGDVHKDIVQVKELLKGRCVLGKAKTCLDPSLYRLEAIGAEVKLFSGNLNELAPAVIKGEAEATILDVPDALIALEKWPGKLKVIGPISSMQEMGVAFAKTSPMLREAFNRFFEKCKANGTYQRLVKKYYPGVFMYYPGSFEKI